MKVLLWGGGLQGLACGASFHDKGFVVDAVSSELDVRKSKFFRKVYAVERQNNLSSLGNILGSELYDVVLPMGDTGVSFLSKNKQQIEQDYNTVCACPDYQQLEIVENKQNFMSFCEKHSIPHPKTTLLSEDTLQESAETIGFPALIKPDYSVGARGITRVNDLDELKSKFPVIQRRYGSCTLQEFVDNDEYYYNVMLYRSKNGECFGHTIIKIIRKYPISAGSSSFCISVQNDELLKICKDCLDKLDWVGIADFDVLQRLDNNEYKIIEINARVPASLRAATVSGVDFPEIIVSDAVGDTVPHYEYHPGKSLRYLGIDIMWFLKSPNRFRSKPCWLKFWGKNLYYQDIYSNDFSTWWTWFVGGLIKIRHRNMQLR